MLSPNQLKWLRALAFNKTTIEEARVATQEEIDEYIKFKNIEKRDIYDQSIYINTSKSRLPQKQVSELFIKDDFHFAKCALNNVAKIVDPLKADLRVEACELALKYHAKRVIDYGTGCGVVGLMLKALGIHNLCCADVADAQLDFVIWRMRRRNYRNITVWNIFKQPFSENPYDCAVLFDVFSVIESPVKTINVLSSIIKDQGIVITNLNVSIPEQSKDKFAYLVGKDANAIIADFNDNGFQQIYLKEYGPHLLAAFQKQ